jgi:transposase
MIAQESRILIRYFVNQGEPKACVARRLGVCRQTVYTHLKEKPSGSERAPRPSKLDAHKAYLAGRLAEFDLPAAVLFRELKGRGYTGSTTIVADYVRSLKQEKVRRLTERFETSPGQQAQVDWGECGSITVDGLKRSLYVFVFVLGFSRMLFARFTTSTRQHVLHGCLQQAFERLGLPAEVLVDNMKQAVSRHTAEGVEWNRSFLDFCEHYGVAPKASPPYWPRAKGKVERGVGYLKHSFLEGRAFADLEDLNRQLEVWLDTVANVRIHGTTGEQPVVRYQAELPHLKAYATLPALDTRLAEPRKAGADCLFRYGGVSYSVDPRAAGKTVLVKSEGERLGSRLEVSLAGEVVAVHTRQASGSPPVILPQHAEQIRALCRQRGPAKRGRTVAFTQLPADTPQPPACPSVESRSLELYEALLSRAGRN